MVIACLGAGNRLDELTKEHIGVAAIAICQIMAFTFALLAYIRLRRPDAPRGRGLAIGGIIAATVWPIVIAAWVFYCLSQGV
jgi:hypothetical protein